MEEVKFSSFLYSIGLLSKENKVGILGGVEADLSTYKFNGSAIYFDSNERTYKRWADTFGVAAQNLLNVIDHLNADDYRHIRFTLGLYDGTASRQNFLSTKVIARLDTDKSMSVDELLIKLEIFGELKPNVIHKTYKGWHAFWISDEWIEKEDEALIDKFVAILDSIRVKNQALWIDKIDGIGAMTRIICAELPAYIINPATYTQDILAELHIDKENTEYTYITPTFTEFEDVFNQCQSIQILDNSWETHDYNQWFMMAWLYAVRYVLSDNNDEVEKDFVSKSLLWRKGTPNYKAIVDMFKSVLNFATKQEGTLILPSCRKLYMKGVCEKCLVFRKSAEGVIFSHPFRDANKFKIEILGFIMEGDKWYAIERVEQENGDPIERKIEVSKAFKITKLIRKVMPVAIEDYMKVLTNNKYYIIEKDNRSNAEIDLSHIANIIPIKNKQKFRKLIEEYLYILQSDPKTMIEIDFVGYRKRAYQQAWDVMIGNENVSEPELYSVLYGYFARDESVLIDYLPATKGSHEEWKQAYIRLFELKEPLILYLIGFFLSHFLLDWFREEFGFALTPIVAIRGESRIGKTKRTLMALALFGKPKEFSFSSITEARVKNQFGIIKTPIFIDEVVSKGNDYEKMRSLLYHMANASIKADAYKTAPPITVPIVLTGEPNNFTLEKAFNEFNGLIRRVFTLLLKREEHLKDIWHEIDSVIFPTLNKNYGFIVKHLSAFQRSDLNKEYVKMNKFVRDKFSHFIDTLYEEHFTHITLSFMAFKFFYQDLGMSDKAIEENIELIAAYLLNKSDLIKDLVITNTTFEDICIEASNKFVEAMQNKKQFQAYLLTKALNTAAITLQALDSNEKRLFNLVFGKLYKSRNFGFVKTAILDPLYKEEDLDRLKHNKGMCKVSEWQDFVLVYKQLLHRKYDLKVYQSICNFFAHGGLPEFAESKEVKETEKEPDIDF
ncbi:TPA: DUF927 helicase [Aquificae Joseph's Coat Spring virus]|nr:TPA: DUF927 helicase [Aquificae Joseph's Coat Spring virus]